MQEKGAKATLLGAVLFTTFTIWAVHWQQDQEREVRHSRKRIRCFVLILQSKNMYKGVLRDDERRREKMRKRQEELQESRRKRELYGSFQTVEGES